MKQLILGGIRSGKSAMAEKLAMQTGLPVSYIATATALDEAMKERIAIHRKRRPDDWRLIEEPLELAGTLQQQAREGHCILVDCLSLWLTNLLLTGDDERPAREIAALLETLPELAGDIIMVSSETNMGIIPMDSLSRRFCDEAGYLHQRLAQDCQRVIMSVAGLPLIVKDVDRQYQLGE